MLVNQAVAVKSETVVLVPYYEHHVVTYNEWMQDKDLQDATASEPLSLMEEYDMQRSWRNDSDKLTFICCLPFDLSRIQEAPEIPLVTNESLQEELESMFGDVNLFLQTEKIEDEGGVETADLIVGELELMVARKEMQGQGLGRACITTFMKWVGDHEDAILLEFLHGKHSFVKKSGSMSTNPIKDTTDTVELVRNARIHHLRVRVNNKNNRSLGLFSSLNFKPVGDGLPNFFDEIELRLDLASSVPEERRALLAFPLLEGYQIGPYGRSEGAKQAPQTVR